MAGRDLLKLSATLLVLGLFTLDSVNANCKAHDAKWKKGQDLQITQPSRTDPSKIRVSWTNMVDNERCVDEFVVYAWKKGLERKNGTNYKVAKNVFSKEVTVDPCVEYNFQVETKENDLFGADMEKSKVKLFKPAAVAKIRDTDKRNFWVGYHFDKVRKVYDLSKVAIRFRKGIIQNINCVKHIEIIGTETSRTRNPGSFSRRTGGGALKELSPTYGMAGFGYGGGRNDYPGLSSSSSSSSIGGHSYYGGHSKGSSSWSSVVGGSNNYKGSSGGYGSSGSYGSSGGYPGSYGSTVKGYGSYPGYPGSSHGSHGRYKRGLFSSSKKKTTPRPSGREAAPSGTGRGKAAPPFNHDIIEVNAKIKPCQSYKFTLKIVTPQSSTLGQIKDLELPLVTEMADYRPPPLSKLFKVEHKANMGPVIKLQPGYGVPAACLKDFFEAVDLHMENMEDGISHQKTVIKEANTAGYKLKQMLSEERSEQLDLFGCKCNATRLVFNTTDPKLYRNNREVFGVYKYIGLHNNKPYYRRMDSAQLPSTSRPGYANASPSSSFHYTPPSSGEQVFYLYWDDKNKAWAVGKQRNNKGAEFRTKKNSVAKCPGDSTASGTWQRSGTLSWKDDPNTRARCGMGIFV